LSKIGDTLKSVCLAVASVESPALWRLREKIKQWKEKGITEIEDAGKLHKLKYSLYEDIEFNKPYKVAKKINCPVFIVHGDHDTCVPVTQSRKFAGLVKNGRLHEIKGADHWFPEGPQRTEMVEKVYEFITNKVK